VTTPPSGPAADYPPTAEMLVKMRKFLVVLPAVLLVIAATGLVLVGLFLEQGRPKFLIMALLAGQTVLVAVSALGKLRQFRAGMKLLEARSWAVQRFDMEHVRTVKARAQKSFITLRAHDGSGPLIDTNVAPQLLSDWETATAQPIWAIVGDTNAVMSIDDGRTVIFSTAFRSAS